VASRAFSPVCFLIGLLFCTSASADAYFPASGTPLATFGIVITGEITERDAAFFASHSTDFAYRRPSIFLNSRGGDVGAAMKIGRIIRAAWGTTWILGDSRCYSSCALIFIAGVERWQVGELGLHRPYLASAPLSREQIETQMPVMRSAVKEYVQEMGITDIFFERMFNTEPSEIDILGDEGDKIVPGTDPTYDEIVTSLGARHHGITTSEYRRRNSLRKSCFISDSSGLITGLKYPDCPEATMWDLPPATYRSRSAKAKVSCSFSDSEEQLLRTIPSKDRFSHLIYRRFNACWLDTMRGLPPPPKGFVRDVPPTEQTP
jgi:hypothetical protein